MEVNILEYLEGVKNANLAAIEAQRVEFKRQYDELKAGGENMAQYVGTVERALKRLDAVEATLGQPIGTYGSPYATKSIGETVATADGLKEFRDRIGLGDGKAGFTQGLKFSIPIRTLFVGPDEAKTTISSSTVGSSTPGILVPSRVPGIVKPGVRRTRVRDLIPRFPTSNNTVEFVKENVFTNNASPQTNEGDAKQESALTFTIDYETVKTLAHWIPASRQILDDFAQLQSYIDQRLMEGLKDKEDTQILAGSGSSGNINGLTNEAAAYDTGRNASGDTYVDKINHAISQVEDVDLTATGVILHPRDWRAMQLIKDQASNVGAYIMGGPRGDAEPMIWGLPVATTTAVTVGKFYVGAFQTHTAIWDRMDARVEISTEHSDYFTKNLVAIRAEERLAFTVYRSDAVVYGSF